MVAVENLKHSGITKYAKVKMQDATADTNVKIKSYILCCSKTTHHVLVQEINSI